MSTYEVGNTEGLPFVFFQFVILKIDIEKLRDIKRKIEIFEVFIMLNHFLIDRPTFPCYK